MGCIGSSVCTFFFEVLFYGVEDSGRSPPRKKHHPSPIRNVLRNIPHHILIVRIIPDHLIVVLALPCEVVVAGLASAFGDHRFEVGEDGAGGAFFERGGPGAEALGWLGGVGLERKQDVDVIGHHHPGGEDDAVAKDLGALDFFAGDVAYFGEVHLAVFDVAEVLLAVFGVEG